MVTLRPKTAAALARDAEKNGEPVSTTAARALAAHYKTGEEPPVGGWPKPLRK